uniref:Dihydroflavonol 4-reductase n=1 Tax=Dryopteris erythrosora TaxID=239562 RepID=A0A5P8I1Y3_9MONI|nr:dihydroflavonol 4-reductase [Dryopteris erythrosora]
MLSGLKNQLMALVCVTGGNGFIASWLIKRLLERGYTVRATVRDPGNLRKIAHLQNLPHASERLELVKADLLNEGSFDTAVEGCEGVFHVASPVNFVPDNPEEDLIIPAIEGTLNVLNACAKSNCLKRVVLTSSMAAVSTQTLAKSGFIVDESCWSDPDYCKERNRWYALSKLLAEQRAWEFAKEKGLDLVVLNPGFIAGRPLQDSLDVATEEVLNFLTGQDSLTKDSAFAWVGVKDVVEAHILALEVPMASGRYICAEQVMDAPTLLQVLQKIIPGHAVPPKYVANPLPPATLYKVSTEKLKKLGLTLGPIEDALKETVDYLLGKGLLPKEIQT